MSRGGAITQVQVSISGPEEMWAKDYLIIIFIIYFMLNEILQAVDR